MKYPTKLIGTITCKICKNKATWNYTISQENSNNSVNFPDGNILIIKEYNHKEKSHIYKVKCAKCNNEIIIEE